jgi:hypothetical protein
LGCNSIRFVFFLHSHHYKYLDTLYLWFEDCIIFGCSVIWILLLESVFARRFKCHCVHPFLVLGRLLQTTTTTTSSLFCIFKHWQINFNWLTDMVYRFLSLNTSRGYKDSGVHPVLVLHWLLNSYLSSSRAVFH